MSLIIQTVFANLIDWLFKPLDNLCSQLLTGAFSGLVGSMSNDEWNVAITAANRIGWIMGFVNMALCVIGALQAAAKGSVADVIKSFAMAVLAWPLTAVCISVMITMDGIVGQITHKILTVPLNGAGTSDPFGDSIVSNLIGTIVKTTGGYDLIIRCVVDSVLFLAVLALAGMLPNPLALFFFSPDPQRMNVVSPSNGWFWLLLTMFIVAVLHDSLPSLLRRLGWMMDEPKTASASLTSMVEDHYGVSNLEVDWFGTAAGGVPPFDGLYSCCYDTGRRKNNGVLRVQNHRVWLYGPDGCEEERHEH